MKSLQNLDLKGKRVLMRVDFNLPLKEDGSISDDSKIVLALPSIHYILKQGGRLILMSHLGRPKGAANPKFSLKPCVSRLETLLGKEVKFGPDCMGKEIEEMSYALKEGEVMLLENLRFHLGEEHPEKDPSFAPSLSKLGDVYVNDAFGAAHRSHASTVTITKFFPKSCAIGFLMEKEIAYLSKIIVHPKRPFYAIIGGAKIGSKIGVFQALGKKVDAIFIGGGMAFTFFKAKSISIGDSICDDEKVEDAKKILTECTKDAVQVYLPIDIVITNGSEPETVHMSHGIPNGWKGMDVGPQTVEKWSENLTKGSTIFWNGPMGVFEEALFANGTHRLAQNLSMMSGEVIVGGGDSLAAIQSLHLQKKFAHLSSGGGASLEFIEKGTLPGIEALSRS